MVHTLGSIRLTDILLIPWVASIGVGGKGGGGRRRADGGLKQPFGLKLYIAVYLVCKKN